MPAGPCTWHAIVQAEQLNRRFHPLAVLDVDIDERWAERFVAQHVEGVGANRAREVSPVCWLFWGCLMSVSESHSGHQCFG